MKMKSKFCRTSILSVLPYGTECWTTKQVHIDKIGASEMRMFRWMCGKTLKDQISNLTIQAQRKVVSIKEKMAKHRLCWFGHAQRRPLDIIIKSNIIFFCHFIKRRLGRPKRT